MNLLRIATLAFLLVAAGATVGRGQSEADSLRVSELVAAESAVDSMRAEIRRLDREIQTMKQDYADGGDVERLLDSLAGASVEDAEAPEDTRSRRQRVDTLLKAITQRPGQLRFNGGATVVAQDLVGGEFDGAAGTGSLDLYAVVKANAYGHGLHQLIDVFAAHAEELGVAQVTLSNFPGGFPGTGAWEKAIEHNVDLIIQAMGR